MAGQGLIGTAGGLGSYNPEGNVPASEVELAPGQTADADLGFYLDLSEVNLPQPIRGERNAPTDPGPRTFAPSIAVTLHHGSSAMQSPY